MKDYYDILDIPLTATQEEIKARYKQLVRIYHPDRFSNALDKLYAERKLKEINEAYTYLVATDSDGTRYPGSTRLPAPTVEPAELDFGVLRPGEPQVLRFQVNNTGGTATTINFVCSEENSWFRVTKGRRVEQNKPLPLEFEVVADINALVLADKVGGWIEIDMDGVTTRVQLAARTKADLPAGSVRRIGLIAAVVLFSLLLIVGGHYRAELSAVLAALWPTPKSLPVSAQPVQPAGMPNRETQQAPQSLNSDALMAAPPPPTPSPTNAQGIDEPAPGSTGKDGNLPAIAAFAQPNAMATSTPTRLAGVAATAAMTTTLTATNTVPFAPTQRAVPPATTTPWPTLTAIATKLAAPIATVTATRTSSPTNTAVPATTATLRPTNTPTATATWTHTATPPNTATATFTATRTPTAIPSPSQTATLLPTTAATPRPTNTPTPWPTATPTDTPAAAGPLSTEIANPTPLATPGQAVTVQMADGSQVNGVSIVVSGPYSVNVRATTSVESARLMTVEVGTILPAIARTIDNTWLQIVLPNGRAGWVFRETVGVAVAVIDGLPVVFTQ